MADNTIISDDQLREELKELTGKDTGPVLPSTKPALIKRLLKLRSQSSSNSKHVAAVTSPSPTSFAFSSDEEEQQQHDAVENAKQAKFAARNGSSNSGRRSVGTKKSVTGRVASKPENNKKKNGRNADPSDNIIIIAEDGVNGYGGATSLERSNVAHIPSEDMLRRLSNKEILTRLLKLTGKRFPISDSTRGLHIKKLHKLLVDGNTTSSTTTRGNVPDTPSESLIMETQFSDSDEEDMDCELSPQPPSHIFSLVNQPEMVNRSVNTSSFLDITTPGVRELDDSSDPECVELPSPSSDVCAGSAEVTSSSHSKQTRTVLPELPSRLPSPNLSSTRRSFIPSSVLPVNPQPTSYRQPSQPSPPRSVYARRPIRAASANFVQFNQDITPKPTSRLSSAATHQTTKITGSHPSTPNYSTRYSTGGGAVINPTNPTKRDKVAKDADMMLRDKGKHFSYIYSKALVIGLTVFLIIVLASYLYLKVTAPVPLESIFQPRDVYRPLLESESASGECDASSFCYPEKQVRESKHVVDILRIYLSQHAGYFECKKHGYADRKVPQSEAKFKMREQYGNDAVHLWNAVLGLLMKNPHWNIKLTGETAKKIAQPSDIWWLESVESEKPWSCVIANAMSRIISIIIGIAAVSLIGYFSFLYGRYKKRNAQQQEELLFELVEQITDLLEAQYNLSRENGSEKPYLAISHVHNKLINPANRKPKQSVWTRAVAYIKDNETRVREEVQQVQGEEFQVWRWLQSTAVTSAVTADTNSRWQGSAIRSKARLTFKPKLCMKIRGMFDVFREIGTEWTKVIQDDIVEKLGSDHGIVHIIVDRDSPKNQVYVKFGTTSHAGRAYSTLNGTYYSGQCIECKFIEPRTYFRNFPEAEFATLQVRPDSEKLSKGGPVPRIYPLLGAYR